MSSNDWGGCWSGSYRETVPESWSQVVPAKVSRPKMASGQRSSNDRGHSVDELKQMSMDEFIKLLPSRQRRSLLKGLTNEQRILMEHVRQSRKENAGKPVPVKSHVRDMIVIPEMLGLTLQLHSGK